MSENIVFSSNYPQSFPYVLFKQAMEEANFSHLSDKNLDIFVNLLDIGTKVDTVKQLSGPCIG
jgi:hypothetical protein